MTDDLPAGRSNCILLGLPDDPRTHFAFAHAGHRCHALRRPEPVDEAFQEAYCLAARHVECPRYRVWAGQRGGPSVPAAAAVVGAAAATSAAQTGGEAAIPAVPHVTASPASSPEALAEAGFIPAEAAGPAVPVPAAWDAVSPAGDAAPPEASVVPPAEESAAAPLAWSADLLAGSTALTGDDAPDGQPQGPGPAPEPVPTAAPSLSLAQGTSKAAPGPTRRRSGRGRLARLARGALLLVLLVAAAGAAGYGLAFVMTRMSDGAGGIAASPTAAPLSPSAVAGSAAPPSTSVSATARPTKARTASPTTPGPTGTPVYRVHVVKAGETISAIAAKYKTTVEAIVELNKLSNPNVIYAGQKLLIPPA
jgi:LysM repeat protein